MDPQAIDALAIRAQAGDREAFRVLVMETQSAVRLTIAWRACSQDMVEEVLQATFVAAFQSLQAYRPEGTFAAWLKGIARNLIAKELQSRRRQVELHGNLVDRALLTPETDDHDDDGVVAALQDCLTHLSPRARLLVERRYADDLPLAVIAQQFKQKANTIATILMRIRSELHDCMAAKGATT
jgi:RNA polymerase sigma-70 factor (ECF subfamily)